jgi:putative permease
MAARRSIRDILADPQFVALAVVFVAAAGLVWVFGQQLAPFVIAIIFAYFLNGGVNRLTQRGIRRGWAIAGVFTVFFLSYVALLVGPLQRVVHRSVELAGLLDLQNNNLVQLVESLLNPVLSLIPQPQQSQLVNYMIVQISAGLEYLIQQTLASIPQFTGWLIYLFLIPFLVFFFLKDKDALIQAFLRCLPRRRRLVEQIWNEMEEKMGNYVRGKIWEILVVGTVTWLALWLLGYQNPVVMGVLSGISVVVPYVGAIGAAVPIFLIGYVQWGFTWELGWVMIAYTAIQLVDGNVLVPLLFSEAVKLHPVFILVAVVLFGSIWGLWGMFFAIPLATLAKSLFTTLLHFREATAELEEENAVE